MGNGRRDVNVDRKLAILVISHAFPPSGAVGARRIAGFCKHLPEFKLHPIVVTVDQQSCEKLDQSLPVQEQLQIERVRPRLTLLERYHRYSELRAVAPRSGALADDSRRSGLQPLLNLRQQLVALLSFPDIHNGWLRPAQRAAAQAIRESRPDAVFSSGPPWTSHNVAYALARRYHIPWIADFRDQWASDPWRRYDFNGEGAPRWRSKLDLWTEDRWVRHAALVVCVTNRQREALLRAHPRALPERVITIPNGCDGSWRPQPCGTDPMPAKCVFLHVGELYGGRRIDGFCKALQSLVHQGKVSATETIVSLVGKTEPDIQQHAVESAPELFRSGVISFRPQVDRKQVQEYLREARVLLVFQGDHPTAIPAKFYEYIQTGKPILALTSAGELKDIVLRTGSGLVADPDDQAAIRTAIEQALRAAPRSAEEINRVTKQFDVRDLTAKLAANIRAICREGVPANGNPLKTKGE